MKHNKIGLKLGASIIVLFAIVLLFAGLVIDRLFSSFFYAQTKEDTDELVSHFAQMAESHHTTVDEMLASYAEFSKVNIYMLTGKGQPIAKLGQLPLQEEENFLTGEELELASQGRLVHKPYTDASGKRYDVSARLIDAGVHATDLIVVVNSFEHMDESIAEVRKLLLAAGVVAFLLAIAFTYVVSHTLSRPLIQMEQATRHIAKGKLETRLAIESQDEVGLLAQSINDLAAELQQYRDSRNEFFANISHELRTPVTYLEGYAKVLNDGLFESEEERRRYLDIIYQESLRLKHMIHDLFELAKMEEGQYELEREWIDLGEVAEAAVSKVQLKARSKGLRVLVRNQAGEGRLYADGYRMEQVLLNLLENAVRYTEHGEIEVILGRDARAWVIQVKDTGMGIPSDELPHVFDRFYRVEKSRSRQYGGTGLGLSIVRKLVELQGGRIAVESEAGKGSVFTIRFIV
jgi:signal transduction histidine kinase